MACSGSVAINTYDPYDTDLHLDALCSSAPCQTCLSSLGRARIPAGRVGCHAGYRFALGEVRRVGSGIGRERPASAVGSGDQSALEHRRLDSRRLAQQVVHLQVGAFRKDVGVDVRTEHVRPVAGRTAAGVETVDPPGPPPTTMASKSLVGAISFTGS